MTVHSFWERWATDPLFARPKESSDIRRRELTKSFAERYGNVPIIQVGDEIVADWLAGGGRAGSVQGLCSMFNDAASVKAGRLIDRNPFQKLGISRGKGRRDQQPPTEQKVWEIITHARKLACPSFAAWLQVAAFTGLRPGELDALRWERIDFDRARIVVAEQFSAATRMFDTPKNHLRREAPLTAHARDALSSLAREGEFCFVSLRGEHWTPSSRAYHWKAVRAAAGWEGSLYLATRHFAGWYMVNELEMSSEDVAIALGHQDGGNLVRRLYGQRDKSRALDRIVGAYADAANRHAATPPSASGYTREAEWLLELDPAWRHAQVVGKLSLGHPGLGRLVLVLGIMLHGLRDEIRSPLGSQPLSPEDVDEAVIQAQRLGASSSTHDGARWTIPW